MICPYCKYCVGVDEESQVFDLVTCINCHNTSRIGVKPVTTIDKILVKLKEE